MNEQVSATIESLREDFQEWWADFTEPVREAWSVRPWWLQRDRWKWVWSYFSPDFSRGWSKITDYHARDRVLRRLREIAEQYPDLVKDVRANRFHSTQAVLKLDVPNAIPDLRPVMSELWSDGWEITDQEDGYKRREYTLEHPNTPVKIRAIASLYSAEGCEVIEHEEVEEIRNVEYEVICEGEQELTGRLRKE